VLGVEVGLALGQFPLLVDGREVDGAQARDAPGEILDGLLERRLVELRRRVVDEALRLDVEFLRLLAQGGGARVELGQLQPARFGLRAALVQLALGQ
jgi:hypothetical protein